MKILVLGGHGYIGNMLSQTLRSDSHEVIQSSRELINFDSEDSFSKLSNLLLSEKPRVIINAVGTIDSKVQESPHLLFNATFLPTYYLFKFYSDLGHELKTDIFILSSKSAGEPRRAYPLYAALKAAENALSRTANELFANSEISWNEIVVPRLQGGLGLQDKVQNTMSLGSDKGLDDLADILRKQISKLTI